MSTIFTRRFSFLVFTKVVTTLLVCLILDGLTIVLKKGKESPTSETHNFAVRFSGAVASVRVTVRVRLQCCDFFLRTPES